MQFIHGPSDADVYRSTFAATHDGSVVKYIIYYV